MIPEEYLVYKHQNKHIKEPTEFSEEDLEYIDWMNYRDDIFVEIFTEKCVYSKHWQYFYKLIYEQTIIIDLKKIDEEIRTTKEMINYFILDEAEKISDNAECVKNGDEPPNIIRGSYIDSYSHKDSLKSIIELKKIKKLISYNKEKKRKIVDWKKTAEKIFNLRE